MAYCRTWTRASPIHANLSFPRPLLKEQDPKKTRRSDKQFSLKQQGTANKKDMLIKKTDIKNEVIYDHA